MRLRLDFDSGPDPAGKPERRAVFILSLWITLLLVIPALTVVAITLIVWSRLP